MRKISIIAVAMALLIGVYLVADVNKAPVTQSVSSTDSKLSTSANTLPPKVVLVPKPRPPQHKEIAHAPVSEQDKQALEQKQQELVGMAKQYDKVRSNHEERNEYRSRMADELKEYNKMVLPVVLAKIDAQEQSKQ